MSKLVYQPNEDFFINVSVLNLEKTIDTSSFEVIIDDYTRFKIEKFLKESSTVNIICFPEYTYNDSLYLTYKEFSDKNNVIIIGGSGIEKSETEKGCYAFCPVFIPNKDVIKVYKKYLTKIERSYSNGRLIDYPHSIQRDFKIEQDNREYVFSVFVCYDILQESYDKRTDIVFVPQYEPSPRHFINEASKIVQGWNNFVLGVNNSHDSMRSIGFGNLNGFMIDAFTNMKKRKKVYHDQDEHPLPEHYTAIYDLVDEEKLCLRLNLGDPVPKAYNFSYLGSEPSVLILPK